MSQIIHITFRGGRVSNFFDCLASVVLHILKESILCLRLKILKGTFNPCRNLLNKPLIYKENRSYCFKLFPKLVLSKF